MFARLPSRWSYPEFFQRYRVLAKSKQIDRKNMRQTCENIIAHIIEVCHRLNLSFVHYCAHIRALLLPLSLLHTLTAKFVIHSHLCENSFTLVTFVHHPSTLCSVASTAEPVLGGLCHERPLVLKHRFHRHAYMGRIWLLYPLWGSTCLERPLLLGRSGCLTIQVLLWMFLLRYSASI